MIKEIYMPFKGNKTYIRIVNPQGKKIPLILLHGGPGSTHNYFEVLDDLAYSDDRSLIMYDQIGCGKSFVDGDSSLFNKEVWLCELASLIDFLNIGNFHLLGQSWGGMLAILYELEEKNPKLKSLILSSTLASAKDWKDEQFKRIDLMEDLYKNALYEAEKTNDYENENYKKALSVFMKRYANPKNIEKYPCLKRQKKSGEKSYILAWGENEFSPTGNLKDFEVKDRLKEIDKNTLVISGEYDLSSPYIAKTMFDRIPNAKWELFRNSRHMPFVDERDKYMAVVKEFLNAND